MTTTANLSEFKAHISQYAREVKAGNTIILCERNVPIGEIIPISKTQSEKRPAPGHARGLIGFGEDFFDDDDITESFLTDL